MKRLLDIENNNNKTCKITNESRCLNEARIRYSEIIETPATNISDAFEQIQYILEFKISEIYLKYYSMKI